jgi:hypothetical protein
MTNNFNGMNQGNVTYPGYVYNTNNTLEKENELLKREIELLKREINLLYKHPGKKVYAGAIDIVFD